MAVQFSVQVIAGYIVGLITDWKLALIMLVGLPVIAFNTYILTLAISRVIRTSSEAYSQAGSLLEEVS